MRKNELQAETRLAKANTLVSRSGQKMIIAEIDPILSQNIPSMQMMMNFLKLPDFLCIGPRIITPIIPETTGLPPTYPTAIARFSWNQGLSKNERIIERPLKMPKQHPKARRRRRQLRFFSSLGMATLKGSRVTIPADSEGGVGGLVCWKMMLGSKQTIARMNSIIIRSKVLSFPSWILASSTSAISYFPKTSPGMKRPMMRDTFKTRVNSWVIPALLSAWNQLAPILAWQFRIKGLPTPATTCPMITQANELLTSILRPVPTMQKMLPIAMPTLVPQVSITQAAGKVNIGYISAKSSAPEFTISGS